MALIPIQIRIPEKDLDEVDALSETEEVTSRSEFIRVAIKEKLERRCENERKDQDRCNGVPANGTPA
jgi:metal-responsive CopG/Arc/MetJ family transcriptional regulator